VHPAIIMFPEYEGELIQHAAESGKGEL